MLKANHKKARLEFVEMHVDRRQGFWVNVLWTGKTKLELFGTSQQLYVQRCTNEAYKVYKTLSLLKNRGGSVARFCSGAALLHLAGGVLNLCRVQRNLKPTKAFWNQMCCLVSESFVPGPFFFYCILIFK